MRNPPFLSLASTINLIAPSFGCNIEPYFTRLEAAIENFRKWGYQVKVGPNVYLADDPIASASAQLRAKEFMDAYLDPESDLVLSVGGGEIMNEILPYVDFAKIKEADPKWFMGFSDNTNLSFLLPILSEVKAIYGPNAPSFYEKKPRVNQADALALLSGINRVEGYPKWTYGNKKEDPYLKLCSYRRPNKIEGHNYSGPVHGTLLGGCLDCILSICGTPFDKVADFVKDKEMIFFLECCDLNPLSFRRGLFQLKQAGYFRSTKLFIFGRPLHYGETAFGLGFKEMALEILGDLNVPLIFNAPLGHLPPSLPFIEGAEATVSLKLDGLEVVYD